MKRRTADPADWEATIWQEVDRRRGLPINKAEQTTFRSDPEVPVSVSGLWFMVFGLKTPAVQRCFWKFGSTTSQGNAVISAYRCWSLNTALLSVGKNNCGLIFNAVYSLKSKLMCPGTLYPPNHLRLEGTGSVKTKGNVKAEEDTQQCPP